MMLQILLSVYFVCNFGVPIGLAFFVFRCTKEADSSILPEQVCTQMRRVLWSGYSCMMIMYVSEFIEHYPMLLGLLRINL